MKNSRRAFIKTITSSSVGLSLGVKLYGNSLKKVGSNDKIRMGFIGIGNRGSQLLSIFLQQPDCEIAALCDVYEPYLLRDRSKVDERYLRDMPGQIPIMGEKFSNKTKIYRDFRKLLENKDIDAVCIATPDHWHAIQTIEAIKAGKDVYVEKPLTKTISEGRRMVDAQQTSNRIVAVGINRRASKLYQKLAIEVPNGIIGKITVARAFQVNDMYSAGIGRLQPEQPPKGLNWDMWLGPCSPRPFQYNIAPYKFRWWDDYSSQMGNWGVHYMDAIRWLMGETAPTSITAHGGKYVIDDDRTIPDTMQVTFEFSSGALASFCLYEANSGKLFPYGDLELRGTNGTLYPSERGYKILAAKPGAFQKWNNQMVDQEYTFTNSALLADGSYADSTTGLIRNFLDCIKSRKDPFCTLEQGHRSTCFAHLANISLKVNQRLQWDSVNEKFLNSSEANNLLFYEYRKPWKLK